MRHSLPPKNIAPLIPLLIFSIFLWPITGDAAKNHTANGKSLAMHSVKNEVNVKRENCYNYYGKWVILGESKPLLSITNFDYKIIHNKKPGFIIYLNNKEQELMRRITSKLVGQKIAIVLKNNILHIGKVKSAIDTDRLQLTFCNKRNFETIAAYLSGNLTDLPNTIECDCNK